MPCTATATFISSDLPAATRRCRSGPISRERRRVETLKRLGATRGISRFVIVQPSFYGADNSATLDALDALGGQGRGVAVIDPKTTSPDTLDAFHRRGVRGLRINLYSPIKAPGGDTLEVAFAATVAAARMMGWHVQVIAPLPVLLANLNVLAQAPVPVVIDHYGLYDNTRPDSVNGRRLLDLVRSVACLDEAVGALSSRPRAVEHEARPGMARGAHGRRAGPLRLGQRLAASADARAAEGRFARSALSRAVLRNAGRRLPRRAAVRRSRRADHERESGRGFTAFSAGQFRDAH